MSDTNYHLLSENRKSSLLHYNERPSNYYEMEEEMPKMLETPRSRLRVENLDAFLIRVYNYFQGKGFMLITLSKVVSLICMAWTIVFATFLLTSVDFGVLFETYDVKRSIGYRGMHWFVTLNLVLFCTFWVWMFFKFLRELVPDWEMRRFYQKDLNINATELQTIEWREVVQKLIKVPGLCLLKQDEPLTPLDIANRIMRRDNYMIAMINKDLLALSAPFPFNIFLGRRNIITKTIEWSLGYTILNHVFDGRYADGINPAFLESSNSVHFANSLRNRFYLLGIVGLIVSPFTFIFLIIYSIFQYGEEIKARPTTFTTRQWTPLARWKFRELNELPHVFQKRLNASYEAADRYVNCFPNHLLTILARLVSFVLSSFLVVFLAIGLWDDQAVFQIELLPNKTALWFTAVGGSIVAVCRGLIPDENAVIEPQKAMEEVVQHTHYFPKAWRGKVHGHKVLTEFTALFQFRLVNFLLDLLSVLLAPFILIFSLPNCADRVIEFFRDETVKEPGVGYVCKFAVFPMDDVSEPIGVQQLGLEASTMRKRNKMKQGKVEKSFLNFKFNHPEWRPSEKCEKYLEGLTEALSSSQQLTQSQNRGAFSDPASPGIYASARFREGSPGIQDSSLNEIHKYFYRSSLQNQTGFSGPKML